MGIGDDMMWRAEAYHLHKQTGKQYAPYNNKRDKIEPVSKEIFRDVAYISAQGERLDTLPNNGERWYKGRAYEPKTAPYKFDGATDEWFDGLQLESPYIVIGAHTKPPGKIVFGENKRWPHWQEFIAEFDYMNLVYCQPPGADPIPNVTTVWSDTFVKAMRVIASAELVVTQEGAIHHAAANLGVKSITLYGSATAPQGTGYTTAVPITRTMPCNSNGLGHNEGKRICEHCQSAMQSITVKEVIECVMNHL